jgi:hypothetical protein
MVVFFGESNIVALYSEYLKNLAKVKWKIKTYILIFEPKKKLKYQKDECSI